MKEFHLVFAKAQHNIAQFEQLCRDSQHEMKHEKRGYLDSAMFFDKYYSLDWSYLEIARLGKFIKSGKYEHELKLYAK